jgi:hypothetical protein
MRAGALATVPAHLKTISDIMRHVDWTVASVRAISYMKPELESVAYQFEQETSWRPSRYQDTCQRGLRLVEELIRTFGWSDDLESAHGDLAALYLLCGQKFARCPKCNEILNRAGECGTGSCDPYVAKVASEYLGRPK